MMNKDTRFKRKFMSNDKVKIGNKDQVWTICKDAEKDNNKHILYKISRGAWKQYVRGDFLKQI